MSTTLGRYVGRLLLIRFAVILLGLSALMSILGFLGDGDQVIVGTDAVIGPILRYSLLRLPEILSELIPISAILGGILTFAELARRQELTAIQAAGTSKLQLGRAVLPAALLVAALQLVIEDQALPRTAGALRAWGIADYGPDEDGAGASVWLRQGTDIVRIGRVGEAGNELADITIFRRDAQGNFVEKVEAAGARHGDAGWLLHGVRRSLADPLAGVASPVEATLTWPLELAPSLLWLANSPPKETSLLDLRRIITYPTLGTQPLFQYQVWAHERLAGPVTTVVLVLLTVALARPAADRAGRGLFLAGAIGFAFVCWTLDGLLLIFGELGLLPPALAAWMPPLILAIAGWSILLHDQGRRSGRAGPRAALAQREKFSPAVGHPPAERIAVRATVRRRWES